MVHRTSRQLLHDSSLDLLQLVYWYISCELKQDHEPASNIPVVHMLSLVLLDVNQS